jgi:Secretion system C-terminal sorting domain
VQVTKLSGNQFLAVSGKNILNNAVTPNGESVDVGVVPLPNWNNFGAATGTVRITGARTNYIRFKVWLRGSDANSAGFKWSAPFSAVAGGVRDPLTGDIWMVAVSQKSPLLSTSCPLGDPSCTSLPANGINLTAALNGSDVQLIWKTQSEINSSYFEIQRSTDGVNFNSIGTKQASGNSTLVLTYSHMDPNMTVPAYYYRLKLVDIDGHFAYSNIAMVRKTGGVKGVRVFPNPVAEKVNLEFSNAKGNYIVIVYNQAGQQVINEKAVITSTVQYLTINRNNLAGGSYLVRVTNSESGEMLFTDKIILQ